MKEPFKIPHYSVSVLNIREMIINEAKGSKLIDDWFLDGHLMEVERLANWLCDVYPEANRDVVGLGVWFHDIGRLRGIDDGHDVYGANEAKKIMSGKGFSELVTDKVYDVCRTHRASDAKPISLEAKILATADAMSHFTHDFYLRLFSHYSGKISYQEIISKISKKLERDYNDKIIFDEAKEKVSKKYKAWKEIISSGI